MLKLIGEGKGIITSLIVRHMLSSVVIWIIADIFSTSKPTHIFLGKFLFWIYKHLHTTVEQTLCLNEIEKVKLHFHILPSVLDSKIEPLGVAFWIDVILKDQIVFIIWNFVG